MYPIRHLRNIHTLSYENNCISSEQISSNNNNLIKRDIYHDEENIHDHTIQLCVIASVNRLKECKTTFINIDKILEEDNILTAETKNYIKQYNNSNTIHSILKMSFKDLCIRVFNRININENADECKRVLNENMHDAHGTCFTGKFTRLLDCLNGFDPLVQINISDSEQIGQIISRIRQKLINEAQYNVEKHVELSRLKLIEYNYTQDVINEWISHIE